MKYMKENESAKTVKNESKTKDNDKNKDKKITKEEIIGNIIYK